MDDDPLGRLEAERRGLRSRVVRFSVFLLVWVWVGLVVAVVVSGLVWVLVAMWEAILS